MSASEIIEQIKKLPPEERREVEAYMQSSEPMALRDSPKVAPEVKLIPRDKFEAAKKRVFEENRELLARLATK